MSEFSFIVPVYKVEKYIAECITSILKIEKFNFEILVIDDASPDRSIAIVKTLFGQDKRLRIIRLPENQGLGAARNEGIRQARGKYLSFIDSDDYIEPAALEYIYNYFIKSRDADVWLSGIFKVFQDGKKPEPIVIPKSPPLSLNSWTGQNYFSQKFLKYDRSEASPHYIFKRKFLLDYDLFFEEGLLHEDTEHTPRFHYFASKIIDTNISFYYYRDRTNSITGQSIERRIPHLKKIIQLHTTFGQSIENKSTAFARALYSFSNLIILGQVLHPDYPITERRLFVAWAKPYLKFNHKDRLRTQIYVFLVKYAYPSALLLRNIISKLKQLKNIFN